MNGVNDDMLVLAASITAAFVGLFVLFRKRYRVAPQDPADDAPVPVSVRVPHYSAWRLLSRVPLNIGSDRRAAYRLRFDPEGCLPHWVPGATAQVYPGQSDPIASLQPIAREYPIASLPHEGAIELFVRDEGESSSTWLCAGLAVGQRAALWIIANPEFAPPPDDVPLVVIGHGLGIAGQRAYIKARPPGTRNWLIFGEHKSEFDMLIGPEIADWVATGHLERCDLVFSRDGLPQRKVSQQIRDSANPLYDWVLAGAAIYVCGRQGGFIIGIDRALADVLGEDVLDALRGAGLYKQQSY